MVAKFSEQEFEKLKKLTLLYEWAHKIMMTKLSIIHESHKHFESINPISSITGRLKTPASIAGKLHNDNLELTAENARKHLKDISGIRIICPYAKDIFFMADVIRAMPEIKILNEKDFVTNPKPSGYRSYHMIIEVDVYHSGRTETLPVEIQIRTEAMNFWSTLEHQAKYKYQNDIPKHLSDELVLCAEKISELDQRMYLIYEIISMINE